MQRSPNLCYRRNHFFPNQQSHLCHWCDVKAQMPFSSAIPTCVSCKLDGKAHGVHTEYANSVTQTLDVSLEISKRKGGQWKFVWVMTFVSLMTSASLMAFGSFQGVAQPYEFCTTFELQKTSPSL